MNRTTMLINRALTSIYKQKNIDNKKIKIVIVDDNIDMQEINNIKKNIVKLRFKFGLQKSNEFATTVIKNFKTKYYSGTGSWNSAIKYIGNINSQAYIAILDDDDYYHTNYLFILFKELELNRELIAIFSPITWIFENRKEVFYFTYKDLTPSNFFIKNPGVQGSNMFFKITVLENIEGFDENLMSATDRDLMIRFLEYIKSTNQHQYIKILEDSYVFYTATTKNSITNTKEKKHLGLDEFYKKYKNKFTDDDFKLSLKRAKKLFDYEYR
jgi:hypothetical protein